VLKYYCYIKLFRNLIYQNKEHWLVRPFLKQIPFQYTDNFSGLLFFFELVLIMNKFLDFFLSLAVFSTNMRVHCIY